MVRELHTGQAAGWDCFSARVRASFEFIVGRRKSPASKFVFGAAYVIFFPIVVLVIVLAARGGGGKQTQAKGAGTEYTYPMF